MNPLPIQGAKVHRPPVRDDVLSRDRLNAWLDRAAEGRLALIVAEAGFGKTTLLADWSQRTLRLTAWYSLEPDDRDWLTFIRHIVGSGRELDPDFALDTFSLLQQLGPGGPTQADLVASLARELGEFGATHPHGLSLVLDDYHVIDGSDETDPIVRAILGRTGPGFSVVIATRAVPKLPLSRLRAHGGVARLEGRALCFDTAEADRLFRDRYHQPLDHDILVDLIDRTEGWPALLSLVRTSLEERGPADRRALIGQPTSTPNDLYDYVAEEVVETLPHDLREFLTTVSILERVDQFQASLVYQRGASEVEILLGEAEQLGLLARPDAASPHRFHPLVRGFLVDRLTSQLGPAGVRAMHRRLAHQLEDVDWRAAAQHYSAARDIPAVERVIDSALELVLANGLFEDVWPFLDGSSGDPDRPSALLLRSRHEFARGRIDRATTLARAAATNARGTAQEGAFLLNLATVLGVSGFPDEAIGFASDALKHQLPASQRDVALATISMWHAAHRGNLATIADDLEALSRRQDRQGHLRYASITRLNLATVAYWLGDACRSLALAIKADDGLRECGASGIEQGAARAARASALAFLGEMQQARRLLAEASAAQSVLARDEAALESARVFGDFGDLDEATAALHRAGPNSVDSRLEGLWALVSCLLALRRGDTAACQQHLELLEVSPCRDVAGELRGQVLKARVAIACSSLSAPAEVAALREFSEAQHSRVGGLLADILAPIASGAPVSPAIAQLMTGESAILSMIAEEVATVLHQLSDDAWDRVSDEAHARPERWATALRLAARVAPAARTAAAKLLSQVGTREDIGFLRSLGSSHRPARAYAVELARRLAPHVHVHDLGAITVSIGDATVGRGLRRKVMGLLCFVASRPNMVATRDEVLDALWPDLGPDTAANSLHQTIYFLRRVFEPDFREGYGAGYVLFDGEIVSLNPDLVDTASRRCWRMLIESRDKHAAAADRLLACYTGKFALDFAYEDWASNYRDTLHAAVLASVEQAIILAMAEGDHGRAVELALAALALDPTADAVELALLRAYKAGGWHSAAAEQYSHYASVIREQLGAEPGEFDEL